MILLLGLLRMTCNMYTFTYSVWCLYKTLHKYWIKWKVIVNTLITFVSSKYLLTIKILKLSFSFYRLLTYNEFLIIFIYTYKTRVYIYIYIPWKLFISIISNNLPYDVWCDLHITYKYLNFVKLLNYQYFD